MGLLRHHDDEPVRRFEMREQLGLLFRLMLGAPPKEPPAEAEIHRRMMSAQSVVVGTVTAIETLPLHGGMSEHDPLWAIATLFLKSPWRWPELWGMNLQEIRNPHLIYPGQVLVLVKDGDRARLALRVPRRRTRGVARRMAGAAMAEPLDQIASAIPFGAFRLVRHDDAGLEIQPVPQTHDRAEVEGKQ